MKIAKSVIKSMGFSEHPSDDVLEVNFGIIRIFSLNGINLNTENKDDLSEVISFDNSCTAIISNSINDASVKLTGDNFTEEDEKKWLSKIKAYPPFILIYFQESEHHVLTGGNRQIKNGDIYTYDAFPNGKSEIRRWEKESLPIIITSLTVHFSNSEQHVKLIPVQKSIFGTTKTGQTLFDIKMSGSANLSISHPKTIAELNSSLNKVQDLYLNLSWESIRPLYAALNETDQLKKFLATFLFIERYTHSQYKLLSYEENAKKSFNIPDRLNESGTKFFNSRFMDAKNLSQRFHWCAMLSWDTINDEDIRTFHEIKKLRDRLIHGEDIDESTLPIKGIKTLAFKLLRIKV